MLLEEAAAVLGVPIDAALATIKCAYRGRALEDGRRGQVSQQGGREGGREGEVWTTHKGR
jgi:hypothetical protein